ncbi:hypothetical protein EfmAA610_13210 [Enterococcus faecium]|nr:hypothetical protein EfmAA610_13210 [Enterococcus faecium]
MEAGKVLQEVKASSSLQQYEEAKSLIEKNKENLEEKYPIAQEFIELKQGTILHRFKHFFGITEDLLSPLSNLNFRKKQVYILILYYGAIKMQDSENQKKFLGRVVCCICSVYRVYTSNFI